MEYIIVGYQYFMCACILNFGIGAVCFALSGIKEFQSLAPIINDKAQKHKFGSSIREIKTLFTELIDGCEIMKQLSMISS